MSVNIYDATDGKLKPFVGGTFYAECPIASILPYGGSEPPDGWLLCQGQEVAKIKYPDLYNVIGDSFGVASDNTKFVLPDMRESVPVGVGQNSTQTIETHDTYTVGQFKDDQYQSHVHNTYLKGHMTATSGDGWCTAYDQEVTGTRTTVPSTDTGYTSRSGSTTHGKQLGVNYIIKATTISLPSDFEAAVDEKIQDIYNVMRQNGAKNLLLVKVETGLSDGITYTVNADKSITLNGTATAAVYVTVNTSFTLNETCIVTGTPKNLPDNVFMYIQNQSHTFIDYGDGVEAVSGTYGCYIQIPTGTTLTNATFYPMIRLATDTDDTYVPYAMTNKELTEMMIPSSTVSFIAPMILGQQYTMASMPYSCTHVKMQTLGVLGNSAVSVDMSLNVYNKTFVYIPTDTLVSTLAADSHYTGLTKEMLINTGGLHAYFTRVD